MSEQRADTMDTPPKIVLIALIVVCLVGLFIAQSRLNNQRGELSPTYLEPLQDAPPMLALTTQALGGFRGLISSYLWLRAMKCSCRKNIRSKCNFPNGLRNCSHMFQQSGKIVPGTWRTIFL